MHMLNRKDLNSAELETGELQTKDGATVYVKELDLFVTVKLLEDTPAVLSLGTLCEDHGYSCEWTSGQKPQLLKHSRRIQCSTENYVPIVVPGLSMGSSSSATTQISSITTAGGSDSDIASSINTKLEYECLVVLFFFCVFGFC